MDINGGTPQRRRFMDALSGRPWKCRFMDINGGAPQRRKLRLRDARSGRPQKCRVMDINSGTPQRRRHTAGGPWTRPADSRNLTRPGPSLARDRRRAGPHVMPQLQGAPRMTSKNRRTQVARPSDIRGREKEKLYGVAHDKFPPRGVAHYNERGVRLPRQLNGPTNRTPRNSTQSLTNPKRGG